MIQNATYTVRSFFQNLSVIALLTPHSAMLHVGLKSGVLSELHRVTHSVNPTFRFAACGAEIFRPFGTTVKHSCVPLCHNISLSA
ncbi:hypothetical protein Barb4_02276 [Bacteroidales bacterium Barb4]|nr:hypothetical protein Barb4_02276 [Bacteroidales bacterium Barb4]